jgi:ABC-type sugar transport system substrate-binding protein/anti-anti-sigma regulatory factor
MPHTPSTPRVGFLHNLGSFPYWAAFAQGVRARAAELNATIVLPTADPDEDLLGSVHEVLDQPLDAVIVQHSVAAGLPDAPQLFAGRRYPVIGAEVFPAPFYTTMVRADEVSGTTMLLSRLFELMGGRGRVVNIPGPILTDRQRTFQRMLQERPGIELAYEASGMFDRKSGARAMGEALANTSDIQGVFAHNDHMALGAIDAIREHGLEGQILVAGFDADPEGLIAVQEGRMAATVYRGIYGIGRLATEAAVRAAAGEQQPQDQLIPVKLITRENLVDATLDSTIILPRLLHDLVESNRAQRRMSEETIIAQRSMIRELSTPVIPITDAILVMPLVGAIDTLRAQQILEALLDAIVDRNARALIIDITGIAVVDTGVAHYILQAAQAIRLLGAQVILVGISPEVAQTMVGLGINFGEIITRATLQDGFAYAQRRFAR